MIKEIIEFKKKSNNSIENFKLYRKFLSDGVYIISTDFKCFYKNNLESKEYVQNVLRNGQKSKGNILKDIIRRCIMTRRIKLKTNEKSDFFGSVLLLSNTIDVENQNLSAKILDLPNCEVLTIYMNKSEMKFDIENYEYFKKYFLIPEIRKFDYANNALVESLIVSKPKTVWESREYETVINQIIERYYLYYKNRVRLDEKKFLSIDNLLKECTKNVELERIKKRIEGVLNEEKNYLEFPAIRQHGDLTLNNILYEKKSCNVYFIDWEHSDDFFFLYDIFWLIQNEAAYSNNHMYLDAYLDGVYDYFFKKIFDLYEIQFDTKSRGVYYLIFILELIKRRLTNKNDLIKVNAAAVIEPIVSKVIEEFSKSR